MRRSAAVVAFAAAVAVASLLLARLAAADSDCPALSRPGCLCIAAEKAVALHLPAGPCDCGEGCASVDDRAMMELVADRAADKAVAKALAAQPQPTQGAGAAVLSSVLTVLLFLGLKALGWL